MVSEGARGRPVFTRIGYLLTGDGGQADLDQTTAFRDDIFWARQAWAKPFTWQRFTDWWASRRYLVPRDVRRR